MALKYVMTNIPRIKTANVYELKSNIKAYPQIYKQYDELSDDYLGLIEGSAMILGFNLRYGDIVIDLSISSTITSKKIKRNGIFIYNGKHLQYLDRTLNGSGSIPSNFPTFTMFPLGYWKNIFNDHILWIQPPKKYKILGTRVFTDDYCIDTTNQGIIILIELLKGTENIIMYIPELNKTGIFFDVNLYQIYIHRKK